MCLYDHITAVDINGNKVEEAYGYVMLTKYDFEEVYRPVMGVYNLGFKLGKEYEALPKAVSVLYEHYGFHAYNTTEELCRAVHILGWLADPRYVICLCHFREILLCGWSRWFVGKTLTNTRAFKAKYRTLLCTVSKPSGAEIKKYIKYSFPLHERELRAPLKHNSIATNIWGSP
jgi:hypothetical protein